MFCPRLMSLDEIGKEAVAPECQLISAHRRSRWFRGSTPFTYNVIVFLGQPPWRGNLVWDDANASFGRMLGSHHSSLHGLQCLCVQIVLVRQS